MEEKDKEKKPVKGIRIRTLNYSMIAISIILYILLISATVYASHRYNILQNATSNYISCEKDASLVADGSDYLTEQVRLYTVTLDTRYVDNYFTEVHVTRRRDTALEQLSDFQVSEEARSFLQAALEHSNTLMEQEIYAMKLIATAQGGDMTGFPQEIQTSVLTAEDLALSPEEMIAKARDLVFGTSYQESKDVIFSNISYFLNSIIRETQQRQESSAHAMQRILTYQEILVSILFLQTVLTFFLIIRLIVKPLHIYINNIKDEKRLEITGAYEFRYLALTYNNIYELNTATENTLRYRAEHDPLTGIMNRGAFDQLRDILKGQTTPLALLIIDVDKFKLVNDGYGHETGDQVLKKVAALLEENFRSTDYPARIGGDEFAVVVTDITSATQSVLARKIDKINETLQNPQDGLPKVSLSVGGAFSEHGFSDDLYNNADQALYQVKGNGRCGFMWHK